MNTVVEKKEIVVNCSNMPDFDGKMNRGSACCSTQPEICKEKHGDFDKTENIDNKKQKWIYESPDNGKTVYRRPFGDYNTPREKVIEKGD